MHLLGDPHLGRSFVNGVPLARRGDRESHVDFQFYRDLLNCNDDLHVCMGDLFDKAQVPYHVIMNTYLKYQFAANHHPKRHFVILKGNHDWQRDLEKPSAFDVFAALVRSISNIHIVTDHYQIGKAVFFAWHPTISATEMVTDNVWDADVALGHWDIEDFGGDNLNLIPTAKLAELGVKKAYTGHIHKPQQFSRDGVDVTVVGSMQPYAHGEEIDDSLYQTVSKKQYLAAPAGSFHGKCLRIDLRAGETLDDEIDCLQLTIRQHGEDESVAPVTLGDFDMKNLFTESFKEAGVSDKTTKIMLERYEASKWSQ